jgi:ribonuclease-3
MTTAGNDIDALQGKLHYWFEDEGVLVEALTHTSLKQSKDDTSYERLEFLGDRVLGLVIAEMLIERFPQYAEGNLAPRFAKLASGSVLADVARSIELETHIGLSPGEQTAGTGERSSVLADCLEAVIGAIYLDGGLESAKSVICEFWLPLVDTVEPRVFKTELQEWAQGRGLALPEYKIINREGPSHEPVFTVELSVNELNSVQAQGRSKQAAEQAAAEEMLKQISVNS